LRDAGSSLLQVGAAKGSTDIYAGPVHGRRGALRRPPAARPGHVAPV